MNLPFPKMNLTFLRHFKKGRPAEGGVAVAARTGRRRSTSRLPSVSAKQSCQTSPASSEWTRRQLFRWTRHGVAEHPEACRRRCGPQDFVRRERLDRGRIENGVRARCRASGRSRCNWSTWSPHLPAGLLQNGAGRSGAAGCCSKLPSWSAGWRAVARLFSCARFSSRRRIFSERRGGDGRARGGAALQQGAGAVHRFPGAVRPDGQDAVPQVETPFLKMTIEDGQRFGKRRRRSRRRVRRRSPVVPVRPIRKSRPPLGRPDSRTGSCPPASAGTTPKRMRRPMARLRGSVRARRRSGAVSSTPAAGRKKISPNGTGVPATERVPASSGPPVPTPLPSPFRRRRSESRSR